MARLPRLERGTHSLEGCKSYADKELQTVDLQQPPSPTSAYASTHAQTPNNSPPENVPYTTSTEAILAAIAGMSEDERKALVTALVENGIGKANEPPSRMPDQAQSTEVEEK